MNFILCRLNTSKAIIGMAIYAELTGITLIGLHSWSISLYQPLVAECKYYVINNNNAKLCKSR